MIRKNKNKLTVGAIYDCKKGGIRRLDKITDDYLYFSVIIGMKYDKLHWKALGKLSRKIAEKQFVEGRILQEEYIVRMYGEDR